MNEKKQLSLKRAVSTVVLALLAVAVVTLIVIGVFLDRIVKRAVEIYGPQMTQTPVAVDTVHLSLLTGSAKVKGLVVGNPSGYKSTEAITVGVIAVGVDPTTVFANKVVFRSIRLESPEITFEGGLEGNNLGQILDNVNATGKSGGTLSTNTAAVPPSEKKFEVDDLTIIGAKVQVVLTGMPERQMLSLPDIHLTNLGANGEGITASDLAQRVLAAISNATIEAVARTAANLGKNAATLKQMGTNGGKQIGNAIGNLLGK
jgi:uncharacterized protein involved in outer membrane biogenesis